MKNSKKRDRVPTEQVSPPYKMSKNTQPSNADLMGQLNQLVSSNTDVLKKIDNLEKKFDKFEKLLDEVDELRQKVAEMSQTIDSFKRLEIEFKKKSVLIKGLDSFSTKKYETRSETYRKVNALFEHLGLNLTMEDYQRLGPLKPDEPGATLVRVQFWSKDDKSAIFGKFKEYSNDSVVKRLSLINDYPSFQLAEVKKLSDESYKLRQKDRRIKTRIVPRGLGLQLQTRDSRSEASKWTTVSNRVNRENRDGQPSAEMQVEA
jgi:hypothetical protein